MKELEDVELQSLLDAAHRRLKNWTGSSEEEVDTVLLNTASADVVTSGDQYAHRVALRTRDQVDTSVQLLQMELRLLREFVQSGLKRDYLHTRSFNEMHWRAVIAGMDGSPSPIPAMYAPLWYHPQLKPSKECCSKVGASMRAVRDHIDVTFLLRLVNKSLVIESTSTNGLHNLLTEMITVLATTVTSNKRLKRLKNHYRNKVKQQRVTGLLIFHPRLNMVMKCPDEAKTISLLTKLAGQRTEGASRSTLEALKHQGRVGGPD